MKELELKEKIRTLAKIVLGDRKKTDIKSERFDELTKFPELKEVIVDLLTPDFDFFLSSIDWVAPKPTLFRINLRNNQHFYLTWNERSWIAQIEGKKYYLLNLNEEQHACEAISRILKYGQEVEKEELEDEFSLDGGSETPEPPPQELPQPEETPEA